MQRAFSHALTTVVATGLLPPALLRACINREWRQSLPERFGAGCWSGLGERVKECVWFHGASVGEVGGIEPVARITGRGSNALAPQDFGYAPVEAANRALAAAGIGWSDVGAIELNEAFAVQSLACLDAWKVDPDIVNPRGGAIAIGHPLGASGGRILGTLTGVLRERGERWGVVAICIGVGQGLAMVLENTGAG